MAKFGSTHKQKVIKEPPRDFITKELDQEYAKVTQVLGDSRFKLECQDGVQRIGHVRGILRKRRIMIGLNDTVLVGLRSFEKDKCDIIIKYTPEEVRKLIEINEISSSDTKNNDETIEDSGFTFNDI
jgi:translation initiation factor 1A